MAVWISAVRNRESQLQQICATLPAGCLLMVVELKSLTTVGICFCGAFVKKQCFLSMEFAVKLCIPTC